VAVAISGPGFQDQVERSLLDEAPVGEAGLGEDIGEPGLAQPGRRARVDRPPRARCPLDPGGREVRIPVLTYLGPHLASKQRRGFLWSGLLAGLR
jgi:hypothetical protein